VRINLSGAFYQTQDCLGDAKSLGRVVDMNLFDAEMSIAGTQDVNDSTMAFLLFTCAMGVPPIPTCSCLKIPQLDQKSLHPKVCSGQPIDFPFLKEDKIQPATRTCALGDL